MQKQRQASFKRCKLRRWAFWPCLGGWQAPSEAPSPCVEAPAGSAAPLAPPVEIDVTVACAAEEASGEEAPPTQPATPKGEAFGKSS